MKYDYLKCNNLDWKTKYDSGFIKVEGNRVILFTYDRVIDTGSSNTRYAFLGSFSNFQNLEDTFPDLEIVPRNSETYNQFKEGDTIDDDGDIGKVIFATPNIIAICWDDSGLIDWYKQGSDFVVVITDYEKTLLSLVDSLFKPGDKVIGRDTDNDNTWDFGIFEEMSECDGKPIYMCRFKEFTECVPFNEETCKLLGTTNDYGN